MSLRPTGAHIAIVVVAAMIAACGGSGGGSPTSPSPPTGGDSTANTFISIVGDRGQQSFTPNPATAARGQAVSWRNADNVVHHIVANDGSFDTGDIGPGASVSRTLATAGANFHCTIHPGMVGAISATLGEPPPVCSGAYC